MKLIEKCKGRTGDYLACILSQVLREEVCSLGKRLVWKELTVKPFTSSKRKTDWVNYLLHPINKSNARSYRVYCLVQW